MNGKMLNNTKFTKDLMREDDDLGKSFSATAGLSCWLLSFAFFFFNLS